MCYFVSFLERPGLTARGLSTWEILIKSELYSNWWEGKERMTSPL